MKETPAVSADGRYVAYAAMQSDHAQVFVRDTCEGAAAECQPRTTLLSATTDGAPGNEDSRSPSISADGRFVSFVAVTPSHPKSSARAKGSASSANSGLRQVFVRDTCLGAANCAAKTTRISLQPGDAPASGAKPAGPALSSHAKHVALPGTTAATLFTRGVVVDDQVFLALTGQQ